MAQLTELEERYVFCVQCSDDLNEAWRIAQELLDPVRTVLTEPAFKYLLVAYARPFKASYGIVQKTHRLEVEIVPEAFRPLHDRLLVARDQVLAHSDLSPREAKVHFHESEAGRFPFVSQNSPRVIDEFWNLRQIVAMIEGVLDKLYERIREVESRLEFPEALHS